MTTNTLDFRQFKSFNKFQKKLAAVAFATVIEAIEDSGEYAELEDVIESLYVLIGDLKTNLKDSNKTNEDILLDFIDDFQEIAEKFSLIGKRIEHLFSTP